MTRSTVVSLLAQHQSTPSPGHYEAALYATKYLAGTKHLGIYFTSHRQSTSFLHFPLPPTSLLLMSVTNWGPKDASTTRTHLELPFFTSQSMSAYYIDYMVHYTGFLNVNLSPHVARLKLKFTPLMSVLNSCWSKFKYLTFWELRICLCLLSMSYIMTIRLV
jgi:hypothetical protein